jgi:hypothetical protein
MGLFCGTRMVSRTIPSMMLLCGQSNRVWHFLAGKYPGSVGLLISPAYRTKVPIDDWMPYVLDNGVFKLREKWTEHEWFEMLAWAQLLGQKPRWILLPDVVGSREGTLARWKQFYPFAKAYRWPLAFAVQDGMTADDVPNEADVVFVGGTDVFKFPTLPMWCERFPRVHCGRVTALAMIERCEELGCESIDATGWFRAPDRPDHIPSIRRFIEGHRNPQMLCSL